MALTLLAISIIGCILAIIDYHADLHTSWSNEKVGHYFYMVLM